ncbi:hypothetical protein C8R44DRAFT_973245 [Mycena epipterygia]|nr:hypothetical protein C8R44DRAFT_973245 [Mycena epipterygia]
MPATQQPSSSPSYSVSKIQISLYSGLVLVIFIAFLCVIVIRRRREQIRAARTRHPPSPTPRTPLCYGVHLAGAMEAPTWRSIQPLAVQAPFRQRLQKDGGSKWPTIKRQYRPPSLSSSSDASIYTASLLDDFQMLPDRHLHIAVLIAMPLPPGPDGLGSISRGLSHDVTADVNMAVGIADAPFPTY